MKQRFTFFSMAIALALMALAGLSPAPAHAAASVTRLFGTIGNGGNGRTSTLVELDPGTGALLQTIGPVNYMVNGLDYDPSSGKMYATTSFNDPIFSNGLLTIDLATGAGTPIGEGNPGYDAVNNVRANPAGQLFAWNGWELLLAIDPSTGVASTVANVGQTISKHGATFDSKGIFYLVTDVEGVVVSKIYTVDPATGNLTDTGNSIAGLAHHGDFHPITDKYWGIDAASSGAKNLRVIDVTTGTIEQTLPTVNNLHTIAFMPPPCAVGIYGAPYSADWLIDVQNKLNGAGLYKVDVHDASTYTPTLAELHDYHAVLVFSDGNFHDYVALGDVLADYMDAGGGVGLATFAFSDGEWGIAGRIVNGGYLPFTTADASYGLPLSLVPDLPAHPILAGVTTFDGGANSWHNTISLAAGATQVAHWSNDVPLVATKEFPAGKIAGLNFYPPSSDARDDFWDAATDGALLMRNALTWAGSCAAIEIDTFTVTPAAGPGGGIDPADPQEIDYNDTATFTVTPDSGYHIDSVDGCEGSLDGNTYTTGPITADCTVTATFAIDTFTVTPTAGPGGGISPTEPQKVEYNGTAIFTLTPNPGYGIASVTGCNGTRNGNTYTTGAVTEDCTVAATFGLQVQTPAFLNVYPQWPSLFGFILVNWGASPTRGVTYELEVSANGGEFKPVYRGMLLSRNTAVSLLGKGTYVYRLRAIRSGYLPSEWILSKPVFVRTLK